MLRYWKFFRMFIYHFFNTVIDIFSILINFKDLINICSKIDKNTIVFISDKFVPRNQKIIYGISTLKKYKIILIFRKNNLFSNIDKEYITDIIYIKSSYKALWILKRINPFIIHIFSNWNFDIAYTLIKNKSKIQCKIVFDDYDVFAGMLNDDFYNKKMPGQLQKEKFCLENADSLCCRSLETQYAKKYFGYKYKGKRIFFPEYMWEANLQKPKDIDKINVIVYSGNYNNLSYKIANILKDINWELDIYPANSINYQNALPENLNLFKKLSHKELIITLSKYAFAIQMPPEIAEVNGLYTLNKRKYAMSGKIFDYIEANLKVLISGYELLIFILRRYGFCILLDEINPVKNINEKIKDLQFQESRTKNNLEKITIYSNIYRLIKFYQNT